MPIVEECLLKVFSVHILCNETTIMLRIVLNIPHSSADCPAKYEDPAKLLNDIATCPKSCLTITSISAGSERPLPMAPL